MSDRISIQPIELRNQRPTEIREGFIEFFTSHLRYKIEFFADEPIIENDLDSGWERVHNSYDIIALKKSISGVEKSITKDKKWGIYIMVDGFANDIKVYFRSQSASQQLFDKVNNWLTEK